MAHQFRFAFLISEPIAHLNFRRQHSMSTLEVVGAVVTIAALVSNNLHQREILRSTSAVPAAVPTVGGAA